ncbi:hypothetical protein [Chondrinema litorale]|uniref:hypothetical protein n=1 Tax=Chondrinema litorale TaxID=2994555 RepID=UPI0025435997|nr:hypothetical protein [Chondrinema litorale]UZR99191.1 hypothetical protein OQ292_35580 [Chondrinema litorale]
MKTELIALIEAFLDGEINFETLEQKAQELEVEKTSLQENIEWVKNARLAIEADGLRKQLKSTLATLELEREQTAAKTKVVNMTVSKWKWTSAAAAIIVFLLAYWGMNLETEPELYAKYEYLDPGLPVLMSQSDDHLLYDALTYYSEGNYEVAEEKLLNIQGKYAENDTLNYYLGASQLYLGKTVNANHSLGKVLAKTDSKYKDSAEWLSVLAELKDENTAEAVEKLKVILANENHKFIEEARSLQSDLNKQK